MPDVNRESCCAHAVRTDAAIDAVFTDAGARFRHIPGNVCLNCRDIFVPEVSAGADIIEAVQSCINRKPSNMTILKAFPRTRDEGEEDRGDGYGPAYLDIGFGNNAGLVLERVKGSWNWDTSGGIIPNEGEELRVRLKNFTGGQATRLETSLVYDTPSHPRSVQMEITTRCNISCSYCTHSELKVQADIPMDRLDLLFSRVDFSAVENVDFTGLGEPSLHPQLPVIVQEIRKRGNPADIRIVTNGTALTPPRFKALCEAGITSIAFSIDSLNAERFAKSRGGAKLQKVLSNLEALVAYRKEQQLSLRIKIKAVLIDNPYEEAEDLLLISARLGLEMPHFSTLDTRSSAKDQYADDWLQNNWSENASYMFSSWAEARWRELTGISEITPDFNVSDQKSTFMNPILTPPDLCRWAIDATFISATGDTLTCCEQMIDIPRNYQGSVLEKPLAELWQQDLLWNYRLPLSVGYVPKGCVGCAWAPVHGKLMEGKEAVAVVED
jgi:molybdenum cofactor biosynthesis enzyme MoaA